MVVIKYVEKLTSLYKREHFDGRPNWPGIEQSQGVSQVQYSYMVILSLQKLKGHSKYWHYPKSKRIKMVGIKYAEELTFPSLEK